MIVLAKAKVTPLPEEPEPGAEARGASYREVCNYVCVMC